MKRVVIVDYALDMGKGLRTALESLHADLDVCVAPSAEEALLDIVRTPPDLMVTDFRLPGMTGFELFKRVHARCPQAHFIMITGNASSQLLQEAEAAGVERFMRRPIKTGEFLLAVRELLKLNDPISPAPEPAPIPLPTQDKLPASDPLPAQARIPARDPQPVQAEPFADGLSAVLAHLHSDLGASAVLLTDAAGQVLIQVGELRGAGFEKRWAAAIMTALDSAANLARELNSDTPQVVLIFRGEPDNLLIAPAGKAALVVFQPVEASGLRTAITQQEMFYAQLVLAHLLENQAANGAAPVESHPTPPAIPLEEDPLAAALEKSSGGLPAAELEEFWEKAAAQNESDVPNDPSMLTYEQARVLGLTPDAK